MKGRKILFVTLLVLVLSSAVTALKVDRGQTSHMKQDQKLNPVSKVGNSPDGSCTKEFCISNFGLMVDPFDPNCKENATCWREYYGFPNCTDDDVQCWKYAVGYPKDCKDDDYDCWIKSFGYAQCDTAQCMKDYLNYSCKYDDLECWKTKTWLKQCDWNDWDCWVKNSYMDFLCDGKKGYDCVSFFYGDPCKKDDEKCWRKTLMMPDKDCEKNVTCFKEFYFLPDCKDDDFKCWKKLYWGPNCKQGDMECLKKFLFVPDCSKDDDEVQCYKKWLRYPDCKLDDGKCWKDVYDTDKANPPMFSMMVNYDLLDHKMAGQQMGFGKMMEHRRKAIAEGHKTTRQFHMKRAGLIQ